jgi:hypothetical protein
MRETSRIGLQLGLQPVAIELESPSGPANVRPRLRRDESVRSCINRLKGHVQSIVYSSRMIENRPNSTQTGGGSHNPNPLFNSTFRALMRNVRVHILGIRRSQVRALVGAPHELWPGHDPCYGACLAG